MFRYSTEVMHERSAHANVYHRFHPLSGGIYYAICSEENFKELDYVDMVDGRFNMYGIMMCQCRH